MKLLLAIQSYTKANPVVARHWPYYLNAGADEIHGIGTTDGGCVWPEGTVSVEIGANRYISGKHLPSRLLDTIQYCLTTDSSHFCIIEYDVLFFSKIPEWSGIAAHLAGFKLPNSQASFFIHNPWLIDRPTAEILLEVGRQLIAKEWPHGCVEGSPDCFLAWVCQEANVPVKFDLMKEFSRNSLDLAGSLEDARRARLDGCDIIHGVKSQKELDYIMSAP